MNNFTLSKNLLKYRPLIRFSLAPKINVPSKQVNEIPFYSHTLLTPISEEEMESLLCGGLVPE